jgi:hypothetical protein
VRCVEKVSAVIIVHNEAKDPRECLETVQWADEIVMVDFRSKDPTKAKVPRAIFRRIEGVGHFVPMEQPADTAEAILTFFRGEHLL